MQPPTRPRSTRSTAINLQQRGFLSRSSPSFQRPANYPSRSSENYRQADSTSSDEDSGSSTSSDEDSGSEEEILVPVPPANNVSAIKEAEEEESVDSSVASCMESNNESSGEITVRLENLQLWTHAELDNKTIPILKEILKERGLRTGGNKPALINRLLGLEETDDDDLTKCSVAKLRERLKASNQPTGGKKEELIRRIQGTEDVEDGTYADFNRYTNGELCEKLKSQNKDIGGNKDDLINRLLGNEPSMPPEGWANSKDREMLFEALHKDGPSSLRFKTAEEVYSKQPYNRWPWYRFKGYFKDALISVLKEESIARQDNRDFEALLAKNPRPNLTSNGENSILTMILQPRCN